MIARRQTPAASSTGSTKAAKALGGLDRLPWDNLRLFLAVAEAGSFRSAATRAAVSINTIRSKVDWLERQIGGALLRRSVEGVALTQDGRELVQIAREMRELGRATARVGRSAATDGATIRIVASEGIGTAWLVPRLAALQAADAAMRISLICEAQASDVLFRDVDIAVQLERPSDPDLVVDRVASLHVIPFASPAYVAAHGVPRSIADAQDHHFVRQQNDPAGTELMESVLDEAARKRLVTFETNSSAAHYAAVANGAGIGFMPTYIKLLDPALVAIDAGIRLQRDVYIVRHADAVSKPEVGKAYDWLTGAFDAAHYPCFAENFVHPDDFEAGSATVAALFSGSPARR
jgi:DNA-binding transcriptional LysR family regulator